MQSFGDLDKNKPTAHNISTYKYHPKLDRYSKYSFDEQYNQVFCPPLKYLENPTLLFIPFKFV